MDTMSGTLAEDRLVGFRAIERASARLPNSTLALFTDGARHELLREEDEVRDRVLAAIDTFLDRLFPR
jgi:lysophospholipase